MISYDNKMESIIDIIKKTLEDKRYIQFIDYKKLDIDDIFMCV